MVAGGPVAAYDFIVVGAGSAGCAVAGRLASESSSTVLLIEAGGTDRRLAIRAPLAFPLQFGTSLDWGYESEPEPGCAGRRIALPRGRALGGTSGMNAMIWVKGSNLDYDGWRIPGWAWADVAPIFRPRGKAYARRSPAGSRRVVVAVRRHCPCRRCRRQR
jgi:choline dehydrogenase